MSGEIKTTRKDLRGLQKPQIAAALQAAFEAVHMPSVDRCAERLLDELMELENRRSIADVLRDLIEEAGGGQGGHDEVAMLLAEQTGDGALRKAVRAVITDPRGSKKAKTSSGRGLTQRTRS